VNNYEVIAINNIIFDRLIKLRQISYKLERTKLRQISYGLAKI